ncbi:MAG: heme lyase CcmF/NrfE family subunit [Gammaproteobacteria bacterium]|nr:heme lyase CcmF/NrfE family subunit [Gammaproteobacteria bacterium]
MIPELGHFSAFLGLMSAGGIALFGIFGANQNRSSWVDMSIRLTKVQVAVLALSFLLLILAFLDDDFSVLYIANNSNTALPWYYKVSGVWGAHEGSFLLWTLVTAVWTVLVATRARHIPLKIHGYVLGTLGVLSFMFLAFLIFSSNPFERLVPNVPIQGADLNPVLQDIGQIIHPPMLYIGYVGFGVTFAFGIAALVTGKIDSAWARWVRPWVNVAWLFLTIGIVLGSWWAYYELGWGGWWFWDPVENASFMPWLAGTALIHSLAATEKRGAFKNWTILLTLLTFTLVLMGAFLVRSGVLSSVHAFAVDPQRGLILLTIFVLVAGGSLVLYAFRAHSLNTQVQYWGVSRELLLLINNALLVIAVFTILLGTLYPLGHEWFVGGTERLSVGEPYFNAMFVPIMLLLSFALAIAPISRWKHTPKKLVVNALILLGGSAVVALLLPWILADGVHLGVSCAVALAIWIFVTHAIACYRQRKALTLGFIGMSVAHVGFAIAVIGVAVTSVYTESKDARLKIGESLEVSGTKYELVEVQPTEAQNYIGERARFDFDVQRSLFPERRYYSIREHITYEAAIAPGIFKDRYITFAGPMENDTWGVEIQDKPFQRWIWFGAVVAGLAALIAMLDKRYRRLSQRNLETKYSE